MKTAFQAANDLLHVMTEVGQADCYLADMRCIIAELARLERENSQQSAALQKYGKHDLNCHYPFTGICDCGLSAAVKDQGSTT